MRRYSSQHADNLTDRKNTRREISHPDVRVRLADAFYANTNPAEWLYKVAPGKSHLPPFSLRDELQSGNTRDWIRALPLLWQKSSPWHSRCRIHAATADNLKWN
jgi:hypothetical protein